MSHANDFQLRFSLRRDSQSGNCARDLQESWYTCLIVLKCLNEFFWGPEHCNFSSRMLVMIKLHLRPSYIKLLEDLFHAHLLDLSVPLSCYLILLRNTSTPSARLGIRLSTVPLASRAESESCPTEFSCLLHSQTSNQTCFAVTFLCLTRYISVQ